MTLRLPTGESRKRSLSSLVARWLSSRWLPLALALLAMLLTVPSLTAGLALDDFYHRYTLLSRSDLPALPSLWRDGGLLPVMMKLFAFAENDPVTRLQQNDLGLYPWWAPLEGYLAFWRPVSAATHWLDYQLWPNSIWAMHLHSLLWFGVAIAATTLLFHRLLGPTAVAGVAALLFAVDDAHGFPVAWLANRNDGIVAATSFTLTLVFAPHLDQGVLAGAGFFDFAAGFAGLALAIKMRGESQLLAFREN